MSVPLGAVVAHDVRVRVRLAEQRHLAVREREALGQQAFDRHRSFVEGSSEKKKNILYLYSFISIQVQ